MTIGMTATWPSSFRHPAIAYLARWGWQASNLRPGGYEPPALTD
jgi:hypothetical protein